QKFPFTGAVSGWPPQEITASNGLPLPSSTSALASNSGFDDGLWLATLVRVRVSRAAKLTVCAGFVSLQVRCEVPIVQLSRVSAPFRRSVKVWLPWVMVLTALTDRFLSCTAVGNTACMLDSMVSLPVW